MASPARSTSSVLRETPRKVLACLTAGASVLTACVGRPAQQPDHSLEEHEGHIAATPGDAWWPAGRSDAPSATHPSDGSRAGAVPAAENAMGSDLDGAMAPVVSGRESSAEKSYLIPALEIIAFEALLNQYDRRFVDHHTYGSDSDSVRRNLHRGWVIDKDPFSMNQFGHPYSGSIYHGFARSAGLDYWESLGYDLFGSALWEVAGETDPPSRNDLITTTFAGSFLGEALFRTANYVLEGGGGRPGVIRSVGAGLIAPSAGLNRLAFGERFDAANPSHDPSVFYWLGVGARRNTTLKDIGVLTDLSKNHGVAAFSISYGLPGKPGYEYDRPFDYFHFAATATTSPHSIPENVVVRGLLYGTDYSSGPDYSGIWGLYGTYDYFSPEIFKVSSTALSVGTTGQYLMSQKLALQGTGLIGAGYTAAGTSADTEAKRDFRYGTSPQVLVALRLIHSDAAMLDLTVNDFLISGGTGSADTSGSENILRAQLSLTVRVYEQHAIGISFTQSKRDPKFSGLPNSSQSVGALSLFYTFLGDEHFGVVRR